ncbi:TIGR03564 family F420-dependent LLM class oxidoreductase [Yinghuangia soli]|uniref:TIGR03564 family F420-dependent LLM class oxidoreductase n=1 Tax=Yinghuangia soli TaxID=2908204 RepID=A0AA41Q926_9ACTN|nr:TIGR03564 family F420-dependent LLM class oxidoreductase [Yinghuangia soli]MCF2532584.1 TIGR03564 family F420-dependent LLM class oxidoreductase [Yinghuangia soli]
MRIGVFIGDVSGGRTGIDTLLERARQAEDAGFASAWLPHMPWSLDALTGLALAGQVTSRIELGTAVVPTYPRHPVSMAQQAMTTQAATGGRLALGIGPSHPGVIEGMYGLPYERPARHVREYVEILKAAQAGGMERIAYEGELYKIGALLDVPGGSPYPVLVAALAPLMLKLAGEVADGTITYWADERAVGEHIAPRINAAAEAAGRPAPRVIVGLPVAIVDDAGEAREKAARMFAMYQEIPAYQRVLGLGDAGSPANVALIGDEKTVAARLRSYTDGGGTDLIAAPLGLGPDRSESLARTEEFLRSLI